MNKKTLKLAVYLITGFITFNGQASYCMEEVNAINNSQIEDMDYSIYTHEYLDSKEDCYKNYKKIIYKGDSHKIKSLVEKANKLRDITHGLGYGTKPPMIKEFIEKSYEFNQAISNLVYNASKYNNIDSKEIKDYSNKTKALIKLAETMQYREELHFHYIGSFDSKLGNDLYKTICSKISKFIVKYDNNIKEIADKIYKIYSNIGEDFWDEIELLEDYNKQIYFSAQVCQILHLFTEYYLTLERTHEKQSESDAWYLKELNLVLDEVIKDNSKLNELSWNFILLEISNSVSYILNNARNTEGYKECLQFHSKFPDFNLKIDPQGHE